MIQFNKDTYDVLIKKIRDEHPNGPREAAQAEFAFLLMSDLVHELRAAANLVHGDAESLARGINEHREVLRTAAQSAETSSKELTALTAALVRATTWYVWLTGGLLVVGALNLIRC